jgi:hypothetical protein
MWRLGSSCASATSWDDHQASPIIYLLAEALRRASLSALTRPRCPSGSLLSMVGSHILMMAKVFRSDRAFSFSWWAYARLSTK